MPNAGLPKNINGSLQYDLPAEDFQNHIKSM